MTPSPITRPRRQILLLEHDLHVVERRVTPRQLVEVAAVDATVRVGRDLLDGTTMRVLAQSEEYPAYSTVRSSHRVRVLRVYAELRAYFAEAEAALFDVAPIDVALVNRCRDARYTADLVFHYLGRGGLVGGLTVDTFERARRGESLLAADRAPVAARRKK